MSWKQVRKPNLDPYVYQGGVLQSDWVGLCLAYVQTAFGAGWSGPSALISWQGGIHNGVRYGTITKGRHSNKNVPKGVLVPLWYSGWGPYGHVLIAKFNQNGSGTAWTSPNDSKATFDKITFKNIDDLTRQLQQGWASDIKYLGWSEFVGPTRVIQEIKQVVTQQKEVKMVTERQLGVLYRFYLGILTTEYGMKHRLGKQTFDQVQDDLLRTAEYKVIVEDAKAGKLNLLNHAPEAVRNAYVKDTSVEEYEQVVETLYRKK